MANFIPNLSQIRDGANFLATYIRRALEAIQAKFPIRKEDIASLWASVIDWSDSPILPPGIIPWDSAPADASIAFVNCIDIYRDGICQYRDDDSLFFGPGHVLHRGYFKTQTCNDDGTWVHALAASLIIPEECPSGGPVTATGLDADEWYYVYWKLDVAGEGPEYRISKVAPVRCAGRGPEHPLYDKLRFVGSFRTRTDGVIAPFDRHANGWVFYRQILVGPDTPTYDLITTTPAGWETIDLSDHVPLSADCVHMSYSGTTTNGYLRTKGDTETLSGYDSDADGDSPGFILPVHVMDTGLGIPGAATEIEISSVNEDDYLAVVAYHEALL